MNKKIIYLVIGILSTFFGFSYMVNGLGLLFTDISAYPEPMVLVIGILIPVGIGSPLTAVGIFLLWKSYKLFKNRS